jgi:hypothetical protein
MPNFVGACPFALSSRATGSQVWSGRNPAPRKQYGIHQGVAAFSALVAGMPAEMDVSIQDGSLLASRVAVQDANPTHLERDDPPIEARQGLTVQEVRAAGFEGH